VKFQLGTYHNQKIAGRQQTLRENLIIVKNSSIMEFLMHNAYIIDYRVSNLYHRSKRKFRELKL